MAGEFNPANPWGWNAFDPPKPKGPLPFKSPRNLAPHSPTRAVGEDELFRAQQNAFRALQDLQVLQGLVDSKITSSLEWQRLSKHLNDTYKVIRAWLTSHAETEGGFAGGGTGGFS